MEKRLSGRKSFFTRLRTRAKFVKKTKKNRQNYTEVRWENGDKKKRVRRRRRYNMMLGGRHTA